MIISQEWVTNDLSYYKFNENKPIIYFENVPRSRSYNVYVYNVYVRVYLPITVTQT